MAIPSHISDACFFSKYQVLTPDGPLEYPGFAKAYLTEFHRSNGVTTSALITACGQDDTDSEVRFNAEQHSRLIARVAKQWQYMPALIKHRTRTSDAEAAVVALGISKDDALEIGREFGQHAIIFADAQGNSEPLACNPDDQSSLVHPLRRKTDEMIERWRAEGIKVTVVDEPENEEEYVVTFPVNRGIIDADDEDADDEDEDDEDEADDEDPSDLELDKREPAPNAIAFADVDQIDQELLEWAGLEELWDDSGLWERHSVINDVLGLCRLADVNREDWDSGAPGQSGIWYEVTCDDPAGLKAEMEARIREMIKDNKS